MSSQCEKAVDLTLDEKVSFQYHIDLTLRRKVIGKSVIKSKSQRVLKSDFHTLVRVQTCALLLLPSLKTLLLGRRADVDRRSSETPPLLARGAHNIIIYNVLCVHRPFAKGTALASLVSSV